MKPRLKKQTAIMESMVVFGIGLAAFYWICESFMYFFMKPEANFIQHLFGPGKFEIFTRLLVLCLFAIFTSHYQYTFNKRRLADEEKATLRRGRRGARWCRAARLLRDRTGLPE